MYNINKLIVIFEIKLTVYFKAIDYAILALSPEKWSVSGVVLFTYHSPLSIISVPLPARVSPLTLGQVSNTALCYT